MSDGYQQLEEIRQFNKDVEPFVTQYPAMIQDVMTKRQQSSVRLLSGGMAQEDHEHLIQQQQQQHLLMQKVLPSSAKYAAPLYSLASNDGYSRVRSTPSANRNRSNDKSIVCNLCYEVFSSKPNLLIHTQQVHRTNPKPYQCPTCNKCFANSSYLSQHSRIHLGIKPYVCPFCHRRFTQLCHLQQHIRTHTGEKPYKCHQSGCTKAFSQLSNLQSHLRSHVAGHMRDQRNSHHHHNHHHPCFRHGDDTATEQARIVTEACRCSTVGRVSYFTTDNRGLNNSDLSYQADLRSDSSASAPKVRNRMSSSVYPNAGTDDLPDRPMPMLSLASLSERLGVPVPNDMEENGSRGTFGSHFRERDLTGRARDTYMKHYDSLVRRSSAAETNSSSSILSSAMIPWCCEEASRNPSEKYDALIALDTRSSALIATAKREAFLSSERDARKKMCSTLLIEMNTQMRSYKSVSDKMDDDECETVPMETRPRLKTSIVPLDDSGTRRKIFDILAIDGDRATRTQDPYQRGDRKKETFFSEVPRVNIDHPLSSAAAPAIGGGPMNSSPFPSSYDPL